MGRRHAKARFKPGVYVFPGGMLERMDHTARPATQLDRSITAKIAVGGSHKRAQALAMAAVRETFEESGLIIGGSGEVGHSGDPTWAEYRAQGLAPNLGALRYLGRAITPTFQPMRFHARFFYVAAESVRGAIVANGELVDLQWVRLSEREHLPMMNVTHLMLDTLAKHLSGETTKSPFLYFARGRRSETWT